jgi:uncharacterized protein YndB with AHSA1/START domain
MDIQHRFPIAASIERVFDHVTKPSGLDTWWTKTSAGAPVLGSRYDLGFGPVYQWAAKVTAVDPPRRIAWRMVDADADWTGTTVGFLLEREGDGTLVEFAHEGWLGSNVHYRISSFCWAMYLRLLKLNLETGLRVEYERRLDV